MPPYEITADKSRMNVTAAHAARAFLALEEEVRRRGLSGIALHVFGHNDGARALYDKLGFRPTNISMFKPIEPPSA